MTQIKDYQVNYSINVTATEGVQEVEKFAKAMKQLSDARSNFMPAVNSVNDMMQHIDKVFRPKGRKREYTYKFDIDTGKSEKKLESIKALLTDIKELTTGINVVINAGQKLDTNTIRSQAKALVGKKELEAQKRSIRKTASQSLKTVNEKQREVTGVIGKINSALTSLEAGREINIRTDAAINRLQYSRRPSIRSLPLVNMFNAYMAYGFIKSELSSAVDYSNIMESARSILKVADSDLSTFETRFQQMSYNVRKIGVDTKFTALEIASAAKFLAMAGMDIATINASMRPISNLALIGDNDVGLIADLTTNIMSGYNIQSGSMGTVADIITSTISRANVNVVEMAESFKMASGYLKLSGVDFSEAAAAIGILGNAGMKGTMAGTALRAMSTRFAKPTKQAEATLDRLGVKFTRFTEIAGKKVEKLRPLAEIFKDLHDAGASLEDMIAIFSKIGGNAAMQFVVNYDKLRVLTTQNRASHGISDELALVKQNTTKGLWAQVTSTLTESFMQAYEVVEPVIKSILKDFLSKFKAPEFARGIASIGRALLDVCSVLANLGTWMARNFHWIEPLLFTGFVATKIFKLAGAVTNLGVAIGFIGKQSVASSTLQLIASLTGGGINVKALSFANKRNIVTALRGAGITGKGAMMQALASTGMAGMGGLTARSAFTSLFANQVVTGTGITGAAASLSAMGAGAVAATAGIAALVGALGWVAYKTWQVKKAKDAVLEEVNANEKYRYPSIEALHNSLRDTYLQAIKTKEAVANVTEGKTLEEESGQKIGAFTGEWWRAMLSGMAAAQTHSAPDYTYDDAYQKNAKDAINIIARKSGQQQIISAYAELGKLSSAVEVSAFIKNIDHNYRYNTKLLDKSLYTVRNGRVFYNPGMDRITARQAAQTPHFAGYQNTEVVRSIRVGAESYLDAIRSQPGAMKRLRESGFSFTELGKEGFYMKDGKWQQKEAGKDATEEEVSNLLAAKRRVRGRLIEMMKTLREKYGGSEQMAENIIKKAGFDTSLYSNEPGYNDNPLDALRVTTDGADDGMAGGNYSGTGKLSSAAPKQVIVQITNLLSVGTIDLMKSPEGQQGEIKDLKEQLAQALIDVAHDFDASWNA